MRLIDAEKARRSFNDLKKAEAQIYGKSSWNYVGKCIDRLDDAETIDAITRADLIDWIESRIQQAKLSTQLNGKYRDGMVSGYNRLIADIKENLI